MTEVLGLYNYWVVIFLMMTGFYIVIARSNLIQKVIGLNIFQISVFLLYITMGKVTGGTAPILPYHAEHGHAAVHQSHDSSDSNSVVDREVGADNGHETVNEPSHAIDSDGLSIETEQHMAGVVYTHPLPSVLMLTAIVVGVATTALALALVIRIGEAYGTIEEDEILQQDRDAS